MKTIRVNILQEPELYQALMYAFHSHSEYEGCYIMQYSETSGYGERIGEFVMREIEESERTG